MCKSWKILSESVTKMLNKVELEQGTQEWLDARLGLITGSKLGKCFTGKLAISKAGIETLSKELAAEDLTRISGEAEQGFENAAMIRGSYLESEAFDLAKFELDGADLRSGGFFTHKDMGLGCSPDGCIYIDDQIISGLEIKCPMPKKHLDNLLTKGCPSSYYTQVQFSIHSLQVDYWYFMSYYPGAQIKFERCEKDPDFIAKIVEVIDEVQTKQEQYRKVFGI